MVRNIWKLIAAGFLLVATLSLLWWFHKGKTYEARCVYAVWKSSVYTNAVGEVVQPETEQRLGTFTDYRRVAEESLLEFFSKRGASMFLALDYLRSVGNSPYDIAIVSNAFASVRFTITGDPVAVVELSSTSEYKDLALDVLRFTLLRYCAFVEDGDRRREDKALAMFKNDIERKRRDKEDVSDLVVRLEKARVAVQKFRKRITVIRQPFGSSKNLVEKHIEAKAQKPAFAGR